MKYAIARSSRRSTTGASGSRAMIELPSQKRTVTGTWPSA
jgi:hypothetical protein